MVQFVSYKLLSLTAKSGTSGTKINRSGSGFQKISTFILQKLLFSSNFKEVFFFQENTPSTITRTTSSTVSFMDLNHCLPADYLESILTTFEASFIFCDSWAVA